MSAGHYNRASACLDYGDAAPLFPVDALEATVYTHRDAELVLSDAPTDAVLVVKPTNLASSYALTQRPLTAIDVASLPADQRARISAAIDTDIMTFEWMDPGRPRDSPGPESQPRGILSGERNKMARIRKRW